MTPVLIAKPLGDLHEQFVSTLEPLGLGADFNSARSIFIKPNLTYPKYKEGVTTSKAFVEQLVEALRTINSTTKIYIGEGEGGYNSFSMTDAMRTMGFFELEKKYSNVKIINISKIPYRSVELKAKGKSYLINLPILFDEIDFSITCPLPKVHCMSGVTLSFKNQWGCLPDTMRLKNHYVFDEIIGQICEKLKFKYSFLDGKYGLDNNGPMNGDPVEVNWFAASNSLGAMDMVISEMMGFNWRNIGHLKMADRYGYLPQEKDIKIIGNTATLKRKFTLKRNFWNYPALIAFKSRNLTTFFYFSRWAKLLHVIMYSIRKKPIND